MTIKFTKLTPDVPTPRRAHPTDAGVDLTASTVENDGLTHRNWDSANIAPHTSMMIGTGIAVSIPTGHVGLLFVRSSLGVRLGLTPANAVGVIDSDYRGEVKVCLRNASLITAQIRKDERICQLVVVPVDTSDWEQVNTLEATERGSGGFGSTGTAP